MSGNDINGQELGWISLHRKLKNHWLWQDPIKLKWWLDILLSVNHVPAKVNLGNELIECGKGQSVRSLQTWASEWKTTKDTARNFLKLLEKDGMVKLESVVKSTRLTVCNYESYQGKLHVDQTQSKRVPNAIQTQTHPNNNENNENNENKGIIKPDSAYALELFEIFWTSYGKKVERKTCETKWLKLKASEHAKILATVESYVRAHPEEQFRKNPLAYLNKECWNDELDPKVIQLHPPKRRSLTMEEKNKMFHG